MPPILSNSLTSHSLGTVGFLSPQIWKDLGVGTVKLLRPQTSQSWIVWLHNDDREARTIESELLHCICRGIVDNMIILEFPCKFEFCLQYLLLTLCQSYIGCISNKSTEVCDENHNGTMLAWFSFSSSKFWYVTFMILFFPEL